jgi:hypothetical protein
MNLASGVLRGQKLLVDDMRSSISLEEARSAKSASRRTSAALDHFLVLMGIIPWRAFHDLLWARSGHFGHILRI